ncbi:hypothetical protein L6R52_22695 [Myxococcota bacterium]|nr:hypothetical protein [Myxococcota bacterium]
MTDTEMKKDSGSGNKVLFLVLAAAAIAALLFVLRPGPVEEKPVEAARPAVAEVPKQPEPPPEKQPEPAKVEEPKVEPPPPAETDAMKAALLGLDKKPQSGGIQELAERAQERSKEPRKRTTTTTLDPEPLPEDPPPFGLSDSEFYSTMDKWRGVKQCLASGTVRNDELKGDANGALRLTLKINKAGEVLESRVTEPSNDVARVIASCVERSAKQLKFPAFDGEAMVTKTAKFVF